MPNPNFLAISLGANHLCSVHLKMNPSGRCELLDFHLDPVSFSSHDPLLWLKATSSHLDAVALRFRSEMPAGFSIPGHVALCKYLKIPQAPSKKRGKIVAFEAKQNIPYPIEEVTWEHAVIEQDELDFDAVIGAARTEIVETVARYSRDSEIDLRSIEPSTTALVNCFRYNYAERSECSLIISIGAKSTDLVLVQKNRYHSRNVPFGGQSISSEISESLSVPASEAERIKISATQGDPLSEQEYSAFEYARKRFEKRLVTEALRTLAVLKRQGFSFEPTSALLTGGGSLLPGLEESLAERLSLPCEAFDPLRKLSVSESAEEQGIDELKPFLVDAIGLGVGQFMPDGASLDLTPRSLVWQRRFRRQQPFYVLAGLVACGAVALPIMNVSLELRAFEQEVKNLEVQIRPLSELNQRIFERSEQVKQIKSVIEKASQVAESRYVWVDVLNDLQNRLLEVEDVWLDKLRLERPELPVPRGKGVVRARKENTEKSIQIEGRLIDVYNPVSSVSPDSYERVKSLLENFREAEYVESLQDERFDYSVPGILRFDFTLIVKEGVAL